LEILQTYQRESKPIQDVYAQVTTLFNSAPDLLEDFKQFLPESAAQHRAAQAQAQAGRPPTDNTDIPISNLRGEPGYIAQQTPRPDAQHARLPPLGNFAPTPAKDSNKRKRGERQGNVNPSGTLPNVGIDMRDAKDRRDISQGTMGKVSVNSISLYKLLSSLLSSLRCFVFLILVLTILVGW
jgi:histone deacetylase complex regulatory component SIN3